MKRAVQCGDWILAPGEKVSAPTQFQFERLTAAVTLARIYLENGKTAEDIADGLSVTPERAAQILRLGISYMTRAAWLRPREEAPVAAAAVSRPSTARRS
jgi:hypothetical protein